MVTTGTELITDVALGEADAALGVLNRVFGYDAFRGNQREVIDHVISGGDALVLMPTGGGKSLCYQIPALVRDGTGVVISPLIALMQDQVDALRTLGVRAGFLNSTQDLDERRLVEQEFTAGEIDLLGLVQRQGRVQERRVHAGFLERADLVLHQRDQRADDDGDALFAPMARDRRHLVAQALAAAGGHQHQRVATADHVVDDLGLRAAERAVAEDFVQDDVGGRGGRGHGQGAMQRRDGTGQAVRR